MEEIKINTKSKFHINWKIVIISIIVIFVIICVVKALMALLSPLFNFMKSIVDGATAAITFFTDMMEDCKPKDKGGSGFTGCAFGIFAIVGASLTGLFMIGKLFIKSRESIAAQAQKSGLTDGAVNKKYTDRIKEIWPEREKKIKEIENSDITSENKKFELKFTERKIGLEVMDHVSNNILENDIKPEDRAKVTVEFANIRETARAKAVKDTIEDKMREEGRELTPEEHRNIEDSFPKK